MPWDSRRTIDKLLSVRKNPAPSHALWVGHVLASILNSWAAIAKTWSVVRVDASC